VVIKFPLKRIAVLLTTLLLIFANNSRGDNIDRATLTDIEGFWVVVENVPPHIEKLGLTQAKLQTDVELRLRKAGIQVFPEDKSGRKHSPYLYVSVNVGSLPTAPINAVSISVEFNQIVSLKRDPQIVTIAPTWKTAGLTLAGDRVLPNVNKYVMDFVDEFANDFLAANPKKN
jgi:hypothetical protein